MERAERDQQRLTVRTHRNGDLIRIDVEDTGPGIPPNLLERIFNPFFTTKPTGSGTGLGLSISLGIVREHEGKIWAENATQSAGPGGARSSSKSQCQSHASRANMRQSHTPRRSATTACACWWWTTR